MYDRYLSIYTKYSFEQNLKWQFIYFAQVHLLVREQVFDSSSSWIYIDDWSIANWQQGFSSAVKAN